MPLIQKEEQRSHLSSRLEGYLNYTLTKYNRYNLLSITLKLLGVLSASMVTLFVLLDGHKPDSCYSLLAGIAGVLVTIFVTIEGIFKFNEKATFLFPTFTE